MTLRVTVHSPLLTGGSLEIYRSGQVGSSRLHEGSSPVVRRADVFTGSQSVASSGTWRMALADPDGIFGPTGIFSRWSDASVSISLDGAPVYVGKPESVVVSGKSTGLVVNITWRDLVDDLLTRQIQGIRAQSREGLIVLGQVRLDALLASYGITLPALPDLTLWYPERTQAIRQWVVPVLSALGYTLDWDASGGVEAATFTGAKETRFLNTASLPVFTDAHLEGTRPPDWTSGREQVVNVWSGRQRFFDGEVLRFDTRDVNAYGDLRITSVAAGSRARYGERKARLNLEAVSGIHGTVRRIADDLINRRSWPHPRATMRLLGSDAGTLRIGDGIVTDFRFDTTAGAGLNRVWRVQGRSVDLETESVMLYVESRDARDEDYVYWRDTNAASTYGAS